MNSYELTRPFWDWAYENPEKIKPVHIAVFNFAIEHCNRMGWKQKFGFPSQMTMEAIGVKSYKTYIGALTDLVDWGFIRMIEKSRNQYSANIIELVKYTKATTKALDKALPKHGLKQPQSTDQSTASIDKPINKETNKPINNDFDIFWTKYPKKVSKDKCKDKFTKLPPKDIETILNTIDRYIQYKPFEDYTHPNPMTYLNQNRWKDEIPEVKKVSLSINPNHFNPVN